MYQQYSLPFAPCSPHIHTKMSHTDFRGASHKTNPPFSPESDTSIAWTTRTLQILLPSFKFTPLLKLSVPQTVWLAPNYYPHVMNIWLPLWSIYIYWDGGCYGNVKANSGISSWRTFWVTHTKCSPSICSFHLLSAVLNRVLSANTERGSRGCVRWQKNQWCGVPRFSLASTRQATCELRPAVKKAYQ
jgi:hypothetical protein